MTPHFTARRTTGTNQSLTANANTGSRLSIVTKSKRTMVERCFMVFWLVVSTTAITALNVSPNHDHPMADTSRLSHMMLQVPSVSATVDFWSQQGASTLISRYKDDGTSLLSAFVALGSSSPTSKNDESCFALELKSYSNKPETFQLGNIIQHIGVSMLSKLNNNNNNNNNPIGAITETLPLTQGNEPNGIQVISAASAPGDLFARISFRSNDLTATTDFYSSLLGMTPAAADERMVCLRFQKTQPYGVSTTLVFEATNDAIVRGNCFDHFVIATTADIDEQYERLNTKGTTIFMQPTIMFGKKVFGLRDPNGLKVIVASE